MFNAIKAGLKIAQDVAVAPTPVAPSAPEKDVPIKPFKGIKEKAPTGFKFPEYTLTEPEDKRKTNPTLEALIKKTNEVNKMLERAAKMRSDLNEKITQIEKEGGFEQLKSEMAEAVKKINDQLLPTAQTIGKTLMRYKDVVYAVTDRIDTLPVTKEEERAKLKEVLAKFNSQEIVEKITDTFDAMLAEYAKSEDKIQKSKELHMWHPSEKLREQIKKEEVPASIKTSGIKEMLMGFVDTLKGIWDSLSDKVADFFVVKEEADPIVDEMEQLLAETEGQTQASKINVDVLMNKINSMKG